MCKFRCHSELQPTAAALHAERWPGASMSVQPDSRLWYLFQVSKWKFLSCPVQTFALVPWLHTTLEVFPSYFHPHWEAVSTRFGLPRISLVPSSWLRVQATRGFWATHHLKDWEKSKMGPVTSWKGQRLPDSTTASASGPSSSQMEGSVPPCPALPCTLHVAAGMCWDSQKLGQDPGLAVQEVILWAWPWLCPGGLRHRASLLGATWLCP